MIAYIKYLQIRFVRQLIFESHSHCLVNTETFGFPTDAPELQVGTAAIQKPRNETQQSTFLQIGPLKFL